MDEEEAPESGELTELQETLERLKKLGLEEPAKAVGERVQQVKAKLTKKVSTVAQAKRTLDSAHTHLGRCRRDLEAADEKLRKLQEQIQLEEEARGKARDAYEHSQRMVHQATVDYESHVAMGEPSTQRAAVDMTDFATRVAGKIDRLNQLRPMRLAERDAAYMAANQMGTVAPDQVLCTWDYLLHHFRVLIHEVASETGMPSVTPNAPIAPSTQPELPKQKQPEVPAQAAAEKTLTHELDAELSDHGDAEEDDNGADPIMATPLQDRSNMPAGRGRGAPALTEADVRERSPRRAGTTG